jgi:hypothetical protein
MDQEPIRIIIRQKLADGRLPHDSIPRLWGGPGAGEVCDGCDEKIAISVLVMEGISVGGRKPLQLHVQCFYLWDVERRGEDGVVGVDHEPVPAVIAVLSELPLLALCMECLMAATGLRASAVVNELDLLRARIRVHAASCDQCHLAGPVFGMAA